MKKELFELCKQCVNQKFTMEKGMVCSLTNEKASFIETCKDFIEDPVAKRQFEEKKLQTEIYEIEEESLGLSTFGIKNGVIAGKIAIFGAIIWLILGVVYMNRIFFYPFFLIFIGVVAWKKGIKRKRKEIF